MPSTSLAGRSVLIVEDERLISLEIVTAFQNAGAVALTARSLTEAIHLVEHDGLSAAVLDFGLADGDADAMCARLDERHIPFIIHSGYTRHGPACGGGTVIPKPARPETLIETVVGLLRRSGNNDMPRLRAGIGGSFEPQSLEGRTILVVQRRWLLARQVSAALGRKGARILLANGASTDQLIAAAPDLSAAIVDGNSSKLRRTLEARAVPYVLYTGYEQADDGCANITVVRKPATAQEIVAAVEQLLRRRSGS